MSCKSPLFATYDKNLEKILGKKKLKFLPKHHVDMLKKDKQSFRLLTSLDPDRDIISIPCGRCMACRISKSREWANRMLLESLYHEHCYFLTLTYDDEHLPPKLSGSPIHSLVKNDLQLFIKRLRRYFSYHYDENNRIRFYAAGEYGSQNMRPHYHIILFMDMEIPDLKPLSKNFRNDIYFTSNIISDLWSDNSGTTNSVSKGYHVIAPANWSTMAYTSRYVQKKLYGQDRESYNKLNYIPEFSVCSRKPGIGFQFYEDHKEEIYGNQEIIVKTLDGSKKFMPPKYYDRLADVEIPEVMSIIKKERLNRAILNTYQKLSNTDLDYLDYLDVELYQMEKKSKVLRRDNIK